MSVLRSPLRSPFGVGLRGPFDGPATNPRAAVIAALFGGGEQGAFYDPSDLSTLYQDSAGTTPVTADGDPVGRMEDVSGNDIEASIPDSADRPLYAGLTYDGLGDGLQMQIPVGFGSVRKDIFILCKPNSQTRWVPFCADRSGTSTYAFAADEGSGQTNLSAPDISADSHYVNGSPVTTRGALHSAVGTDWAVLEARSADLSPWSTLYIGYYTSSSYGFDGDIGLVVVRDVMTSDERYLLRSFMADRAGITL